MKLTGTLMIILGMILLVAGIACIFASASPVLMGILIVSSVVLNAVGFTMVTTKNKR